MAKLINEPTPTMPDLPAYIAILKLCKERGVTWGQMVHVAIELFFQAAERSGIDQAELLQLVERRWQKFRTSLDAKSHGPRRKR